MALVIDQNSESGFVFGSVMEFIKCWEAGSDSRLVLETINGRAWVNFSCCLGRPDANHIVTRRKSPRKDLKNKMRAAAHCQKTKQKDKDSKDDSQRDLNVSVDSTEMQDENCDNCVMSDNRIDWTVNVKTDEPKMSMKQRYELLETIEKSVEKHLEENCDIPIFINSYWDDMEDETEIDVKDGLLPYSFYMRCENREDLPRLKQFLCKSAKTNQEVKLTRYSGFSNIGKTLELLGATFQDCSIRCNSELPII